MVRSDVLLLGGHSISIKIIKKAIRINQQQSESIRIKEHQPLGPGVHPSVTPRGFADLTDVTLDDEDIKSIL